MADLAKEVSIDSSRRPLVDDTVRHQILELIRFSNSPTEKSLSPHHFGVPSHSLRCFESGGVDFELSILTQRGLELTDNRFRRRQSPGPTA
ncbi:hypothetical protein EVAR_4195_1 [Eumeta japonica]|uniref:Uncharacterized protein n=1 Tax=Eumeta variegata TaxID=151549 RepID=A0A4C1TIM6_EUMVA|nr:hypothetical protein EVAR_4195_1 [Eumeta japonica]